MICLDGFYGIFRSSAAHPRNENGVAGVCEKNSLISGLVSLAFSFRPWRLVGERVFSHSPPRREERQESRQAEPFPGFSALKYGGTEMHGGKGAHGWRPYSAVSFHR